MIVVKCEDTTHLKVMPFLSFGPFTTTPIEPPDLTVNTCKTTK